MKIGLSVYGAYGKSPLSRAPPRIPRTSTKWPRDNDGVGRGANILLSSSTLTTAQTVLPPPARHGRSHLFPSFYSRHYNHPTSSLSPNTSGPKPALRAHTVGSMEEAAKPRAARANGASSAVLDSSGLLTPRGVTIPVVKFKMPKAGSHAESGKLERPGSPTVARSSVAAAATAAVGETDSKLRVDNLGLAQSPEHEHDDFDEHFVGAQTDGPFSDRIHVVGVTAHARFLTHAFASTPGRPPPSIFAHHPTILSRWGQEGRTLALYNAQGRHVSSVRIRCPELMFNRRTRLVAPGDDDFLDNVVIDIASEAILPAMRELRHRMDHRTTICLMHPGLGLVEQINEELFHDRNPLDRPNFLLAESTYKIGKVSNLIYSVQSKRSAGVLYVSGISQWKDAGSATPLARENLRLTRHMVELLSSTSGLKVVQLPSVRFLHVRLPRLVFSSLADTISVILGCKYDQIRWNTYAQELWMNLYHESITIISALPELQPLPHRLEYFFRHSFREKLQMYLTAQGVNTSPWIRRVRMGNYPPIDYFNGYLIRRATELGLDHKHNSMAMRIVKARANARRAEIKRGVRLGHMPYMTDLDLIGGGQPPPSLEEVMEIGEV
ncbi:hypothetical protein F4861DRAFT_534062 [Xylaria intraflava]|nr:hypothetical protein F4861DRAFT_534062 [Xylaria intraflava]